MEQNAMARFPRVAIQKRKVNAPSCCAWVSCGPQDTNPRLIRPFILCFVSPDSDFSGYEQLCACDLEKTHRSYGRYFDAAKIAASMPKPIMTAAGWMPFSSLTTTPCIRSRSANPSASRRMSPGAMPSRRAMPRSCEMEIVVSPCSILE